MKVTRGYKVELDLNNAQRPACLKYAGASRFAYNWGLARSQEVYRTTVWLVHTCLSIGERKNSTECRMSDLRVRTTARDVRTRR